MTAETRKHLHKKRSRSTTTVEGSEEQEESHWEEKSSRRYYNREKKWPKGDTWKQEGRYKEKLWRLTTGWSTGNQSKSLLTTRGVKRSTNETGAVGSLNTRTKSISIKTKLISRKETRNSDIGSPATEGRHAKDGRGPRRTDKMWFGTPNTNNIGNARERNLGR